MLGTWSATAVRFWRRVGTKGMETVLRQYSDADIEEMVKDLRYTKDSYKTTLFEVRHALPALEKIAKKRGIHV